MNTIFQDQHFAATPEEVFDVLADSDQHAEMTGKAAIIEARVGGRFSAYGGALEGKIVAIERPRLLTMTWRGADWPTRDVSTVSHVIEADRDGGAVLHLTHEDMPADYLEICSRGWENSYWSRMHAYFRTRRQRVVEAFIEAYKNQHDWDSVDTYLAEDCKLHLPALDLPPGREGMRVNGQVVGGAFPDVRVSREFFVTEGNIVVERAHASATHQGSLMGVAPTNDPVAWSELHAYRVEGDLITEIWTEADFLSIMVQIGAVKMPG